MAAVNVGQVLIYIAAADRRTVGKADLLVWQDAVGDLSHDDVMDAVRKHYRESTDFLMPAHVRRLVKAARADRAGRGVPAAPPSEVTDRPGVYKLHLVKAIAEIADRPGIGHALEAGDRHEPGEGHRLARQIVPPGDRAERERAQKWGQPCPVAWCAADTDRPCRDHDGNHLPWQRTHSKRVVACREARFG